MADVHTKETRSHNMSRIKSRDTRPEREVRKLIDRLRYRYILHVSELPGKPDLVFVRHRKIIEVRGCFWHTHTCPKGQKFPAERAEFWRRKREATVERDRRNLKALRRARWRILIVWECETGDEVRLLNRIRRFLAA
jgi:DNA mismatch endonuclease (patch repair protein)